MKMRKKAMINILGIVIIITILVALSSAVYYFGFVQQEFPDAGCQLTNTVTLEDSSSDSYICNSDQCIVSGSMIVEKSVATNIVVFRFSGSYKTTIYVDYDGDNYLEKCTYASSGLKSKAGSKLGFNTPDGYELYMYVGKLYIYYGMRDYHKYTCAGTGIGSSYNPNPSGTCPSALETCKLVDIYKANWNFCPLGDSNYAYCNGVLREVEGQGEFFTTSQEPKNTKIIKNSYVSFDPTYLDGSKVVDKTLYSKEYDCSCVPAVTIGQACDSSSSDVYCKRCPDDLNYYASGVYRCYSNMDPVCADSDWYPDECAKPFDSYEICDGTQIIGQSSCGDWESESRCSYQDSNKVCKSYAGADKEGKGYCGYPADVCSVHERKSVAGQPRQYQECINKGGFYDWSSVKTCPGTNPGLVFDSSILNSMGTYGDCVCPIGGTECDFDDFMNPTTCASSTEYRKCNSYQDGGKMCYHYENLPCQGLQLCSNGICTCDASYQDKCSGTSEVKCDGSSKYFECSIKGSDLCYTWDSVSKDVPVGFDCVDGTPDYFESNECPCSVLKDSNGVLIEDCVGKVCVATIDEYSATVQDYNSQNTICKNNNIYSVKKYATDDNIIYRWELKQECGSLICI